MVFLKHSFLWRYSYLKFKKFDSPQTNTAQSQIFCQASPLKSIKKMLGYVAIVNIYFWKFLVFFFKGKEKPAKTKLFRLNSSLANTAWSPTPHSVSHFWIFGKLNYWLRAVSANFGFSKNIWNFTKYLYMDPKFPGYGDFGKSKKIVWLCAMLACAESDSAQANTVLSHWFREYLCENKFLRKTILAC